MTSALQQFFPALPSEALPQVAWVASGLAAFGVALWLLGARFSRHLVTLVAVAVGAALGLHVPRALGLTIGSWAASIGAALVLGLLGYVFHRGFVKLGLSLLLAASGIAAAWLLYAADAKWSLPTLSESTPLSDYATQFWNAIPPDLRMNAPLGAGIGLVLAGFLCFLLPRLAVGLFYSLLGFAMFAFCGYLAIDHLRPQLLDSIPKDRTAQLIIAAGVVTFGALLQWWLQPRPARPASSDSKKDENKPSADKGGG